VIQDQEVERIGGTKTQRFDFRVIAATNQNLHFLISRGRFRRDLFYRLNVFSLQTPALRTIPDDIYLIAGHILKLIAERKGKANFEISSGAMSTLLKHDWPGNVRELKNVLEIGMALTKGDSIMERHLKLEPWDLLERTVERERSTGKLREEKAIAEQRAIKQALRITKGNRAAAARLLGIHRSGLYQKMRNYGLNNVVKNSRCY
jgi:DNA-binding NtrC family response regulator